MAPHTSQIAMVGKRRVELSNLTKALYPEDGVLKAHLIQYYLKIAPTILAHVKGRPLSLVRYPEGIHGESFFQKNRPEWAPEWLQHVPFGEEKKDYVVASEEASLVWLANLACIELHQVHSRAPHLERPDYIVYDLDPSEGFSFPDLIGLALEFKDHLEGLGYHPFVKTTGRKGLHILTPIEAKWDFNRAFETAKAIGEPFVKSRSSAFTLHIKKEQRRGKVFLDIYRNRPSQTIICPYSVRGLAGAPVSTPVHWEELMTLEDPSALNLHQVPGRVLEKGDPWEAMGAYATAIHTEKSTSPRAARNLQPARMYKTPEQLEAYSKKRSFDQSPEPPPALALGQGNAFVVHRHHASRLHYDLRLEQNGILRSWAVPKGLPPRPGIMRLAVRVEDHPLEYVLFEGEIPKGQYGGGMMWKFAQGRYEILKEKAGGFYFRLQSRELSAEYRIHNTKENQWLLERVDSPQLDWLRNRIEPMLARPARTVPDSGDFLFEVKWDGIRALISLDEGEVKIYSRHGKDLTRFFPELLFPDQAFRATSALFDGEVVCLAENGKPSFTNVIHRIQQTGRGVERASAQVPAICYLFDCLYLDGRALVNEPLVRRREWLADAIRTDAPYRFSEAVEEGAALFKAVREMGLEGIVAKQRNSTYQLGKRAESWLKIKTRESIECAIIGYTRGTGDRQGEFGALHLAQVFGEELKYVGKVGTGFDDELLKSLSASLKNLTITRRPVKQKPSADARSVWVEPELYCEVAFASFTPDGLLREPVFLRLRPDLSHERRNFNRR